MPASTSQPAHVAASSSLVWALIDDQGRGVPVMADTPTALPVADAPPCGTYAILARPERPGDAFSVHEVLAAPGTARSYLYAILAKNGLDPVFSDSAREEVQDWLEDPGIDDNSLVDLEHLPFVTIDGATSRDLDQAAFIRRSSSGFDVFYALADASYYVRPGSALWAEAMARGASYYLPGVMVPMLPRELSEGLISLNPCVRRRAVVLHTELDHAGHVTRTQAFRGRIRSRHKLSFGEVQQWYDAAAPHCWGSEIDASLQALKAVGELRMSLAEERNVARFRRVELEAHLDADETKGFVSLVGLRDSVEAYNEQLSLLCNAEGARLLKEASQHEYVEPIFRVHPSPDATRLEELRTLIASLVEARGLPETPWLWRNGQAFSQYLRGLPEGPDAAAAQVIHRQAVMVNVRSTFQSAPGTHFGVGADEYARFSAPMRELVGVYLHSELLEALAAKGDQHADLRAQVTARANSARQLQRCLTNESNLLILDQLFSPQLDRPEAERGLPAKIMGLSGSRVYVQLDSPPIDAKIDLRDLRTELADPQLSIDAGGCRLLNGAGETLFTLADSVQVVVLSLEKSRKRWHLSLRPPLTPLAPDSPL